MIRAMSGLRHWLTTHPLWKFPDFRWFFLGKLTSAIGDKFFTIALSWWVISGEGGETANAKAHLGGLMAMNFLPVVLFGPFIGTLVDRSDKRAAMIVADVCRCLLIVSMCVLLVHQQLGLLELYLFCFFIALFVPLFESAAGSALMRLTDEETLPQAAAADSAIVNISGVIGAALGSIMLATIGVLGAFVVNAVSFAFSFLMVWRLQANLAPAATIESGFNTDMSAGLEYLRKNRPVLALLGAFALLNFFAAPLLVLIPMIVKFVLNETVSWVAIFEGAMAFGSALTALVLSFCVRFRRIYPTFFVNMVLMAGVFVVMAMTTDKRWLIGAFLLAGVSVAYVNALAMMLFQINVPDMMKGRFFAILSTVCFAVIPLTCMITGVVSEMYSIATVLQINAAGMLVLAGLLLVIPRLQNEVGGETAAPAS